MKKNNLLIPALLLTMIFPVLLKGEENKEKVPVLVMCRPTAGQIENIVVMKNAGLLGQRKIRLLCVYHEKELTDYDPAKALVRNGRFEWISFSELKGMAGRNNLFRKNVWTSQFREIFEVSDGIIFTGGMDIPPGIYREENSLMTEATTPFRTVYEASFLFHLIGGSQNAGFKPFLEERTDYPVLGICLGAQTMNISAGGALVQDIPSGIYGLRSVEQVIKQDEEKIHSSRYMKLLFPGDSNHIAPAFHKIRISEKSVLLKKILGNAAGFPAVLSSHHQSVKKTGKDLYVTARSMDGKIAEAFEHRRFQNVLGVQFHPEYRFLHSGMRFFTKNPENEKYFSLRRFLTDNPPSATFHKNLWKWFTQALFN